VYDPVTKRTVTLSLTTRALRTLDKIGLSAFIRKYGVSDPSVLKALGL
jgi:ribosomal protein L28